tara:strand:+ start:2178 stop:2387 length:210 start_codon:yes stop_codon:yes gene_type:complete
MTKKDYQLLVDTLNEMNRDINHNNMISESEKIIKKNTIDELAILLTNNLIYFYENFNAEIFQKEYISNY